MRTIAVAAVAVLVLGGCTRPEKTRQVLAGQGYRDVEVTGYRHFACGEDDVFKTGFAATAPGGKRVTGAVCSGWLKGSTIRLD